MDETSSEQPDVLDASRCWERIRGTSVGRIAAVVDDLPVLRPVNVAVDHGTLLMRTSRGSLLSRLGGKHVVFEADGTEPAEELRDGLAAWSVLVEGTLRTVAATDELVDTFGVPLFPWHASPKPVFLRLVPEAVSGRRFSVVDAAVWSTPLGHARRSFFE